MRLTTLTLLVLSGLFAAAGCGGGRGGVVAEFPLDSLSEILDQGEGLSLDDSISADGRGSLCVDAKAPRVVRLFEIPGPAVEGRLVTCTFKMRSLILRGYALPEMWVRVPGQGDFCARGTREAIRRTTDWTEVKAQYSVAKGMVPDQIRLYAAIEGVGRVWIDDVKVTAEPLP